MKNLLSRVVLTFASFAVLGLFAAEGPQLRARPLQAGRASLAAEGFTLQRTFGAANFTPELAWPVDLVYDSSSEKTGLFGFAWRSPQLESSAAWDKDGVLWTAPWGEKIKFHPKRQKLPKDAVKIALHEEARKGRGYFAPYSDWEADTSASRPEKSGDWTFTGRKGRPCEGWKFAYRSSRLSRVQAPSGRSLDFAYDKAGRLLSISQDGSAFVALAYNADGLVEAVSVNGVATRLAYANGQLAVLPKTADGQVTPAVRPRLVSMRTANLDAETFSYSGNYLSATKRGGFSEMFEVQDETLAERRQNILAAKPGSKVKPSGKVAGRLLADGSFAYSYGEKPGDVTLTDRAGRTAHYVFSEKTGVFDITEFTGRKYTIYYFMRYDVAYLGKVRKVVDGKGRDVVSYRYDRMTGRPTRVRDRLGNDVNLEWDAEGRLVRETRRLAGASAEEPVRAVARDKAGNPVSVSILDADGKAVRAVSAKYDGERRPV